MKKIAIYLATEMFLGISCSEEVTVNPELAGPLYGLTKGEPGSVDELIYNTWEEWGMYYLYDYQKNAFQVSNRSGTSTRWYTPMKSEYKELIPKLIDIVQNGIFLGMDKELLKESWFVRTFLCDSLCDASSNNKRRLVEDYLVNGDCIIIPGFELKGDNSKLSKFNDEFKNSSAGRRSASVENLMTIRVVHHHLLTQLH